MKTNKLIFPVLIIGYLVLLLFPNPEDNFLIYSLTMLVIIGTVIFLLKKSKKEKKLRPIK
nr:hypothetical protein [Nanoarchaeum sp.]